MEIFKIINVPKHLLINHNGFLYINANKIDEIKILEKEKAVNIRYGMCQMNIWNDNKKGQCINIYTEIIKVIMSKYKKKTIQFVYRTYSICNIEKSEKLPCSDDIYAITNEKVIGIYFEKEIILFNKEKSFKKPFTIKKKGFKSTLS